MLDQITAADDRHHGVSHISEFLSTRGLINQVKEKIPEGSPIPSASTVIHSFAPPKCMKKRCNITPENQSKICCATSSVECLSHQCTLVVCSVLIPLGNGNHDKSLLLSCNGKAKIDFGEPGCMLSTGVRGKKTLVPTASILRTLDYDVNQKGKCANYIPYLTENDFLLCGT